MAGRLYIDTHFHLLPNIPSLGDMAVGHFILVSFFFLPRGLARRGGFQRSNLDFFLGEHSINRLSFGNLKEDDPTWWLLTGVTTCYPLVIYVI